MLTNKCQSTPRWLALVLGIMINIVMGGCLFAGQRKATTGNESSQTTIAMPAVTQTQTGTPIQEAQNENSPKLTLYTNDVFGMSFYYPEGGKIVERENDAEGLHEIELYFDQLSRVYITYEGNQAEVTPKEWFLAHQGMYNQLIVEMGEAEINGNSSLFVGLPGTCQSAALIVAIIKNDHRIFTFTHFELGHRSHAEELGQILQSIVFQNQGQNPQPILQRYLKFPEPPTGVVCPQD